jgi:hypothetical protein
MRALGGIGPDAKAAVPVLMNALSEIRRNQVRSSAVQALGGIGRGARVAVPRLTALVRDQREDGSLRQIAGLAVAKIDPEFFVREQLELAHLTVRLGTIPRIQLAPRPAVSEQRKKEIQSLIAELNEVQSPDFGLSDSLTGHAFAPLPGHHVLGTILLNGANLQTSTAFRRLVEMGPEALPFLLDSLEDQTLTKLKIKQRGMWCFSSEISGNPLNRFERRILAEALASDEDDDDEKYLPYSVRVADVCFVVIGQIVGRPYMAVRYQPSLMIVVNSMALDRGFRERARALWACENSAQKLLDSLLLDYATEGIFNGESLSGWGIGSNYQVQAAMRLLYYFPKETTPLIAGRLRSLDVADTKGADMMRREVKNGVETLDFIRAVSWCKDADVQEALRGIRSRATDPAIKKALEGEQPKSR